MSKVKTIPENKKLIVDCYEECEDVKASLPFGTLTCKCYISGDDTTVERTVRLSDLYDFAKDNKSVKHQSPEPLNFYTWYGNVRHTTELHDILSDLINKREKRTSLLNIPNLPAAINKVITAKAYSSDHYLQIANGLS